MYTTKLHELALGVSQVPAIYNTLLFTLDINYWALVVDGLACEASHAL